LERTAQAVGLNALVTACDWMLDNNYASSPGTLAGQRGLEQARR
jgi:hypothetical protein